MVAAFSLPYGTGALSVCKVVNPGAGITGTPVVTLTPYNPYAIYPATKVYGVYNASTGTVDGTLYTEPIPGSFQPNDTIEEQLYFLQRTTGMNNGVGQYIPTHSNESHSAISYGMSGIWENSDFAAAFSNLTNPSVYTSNPYSAPWVVGQGQLLPPQGIELNGPFSTGLLMNVPPSGNGEFDFVGSGAVQIGCGPVVTPGVSACVSWAQGYNFLNASNALALAAEDVLHYQPTTGTWSLTSGALEPNGNTSTPVPCTYTFSPTGFSATGTTCSDTFPLTATTTSVGGTALTAGTCSATTVSVTGATTSMAVEATPSTYPGDAIYWKGYVSSAGTVTVKVCAAVAATPTPSTYNVRVIP